MPGRGIASLPPPVTNLFVSEGSWVARNPAVANFVVGACEQRFLRADVRHRLNSQNRALSTMLMIRQVTTGK
jgi:hypothetical protein